GFGDQPTVIACSALRRAYRDRLRARGDVFFAFLDGSFELIQGRMAARAGHFMPESLLESQFATLERPAADEWSVAADISGETEATVAQILHALGR
ncbi:MAG: gluconokinase, partial [Pseudomonadota bacterium]